MKWFVIRNKSDKSSGRIMVTASFIKQSLRKVFLSKFKQIRVRSLLWIILLHEIYGLTFQWKTFALSKLFTVSIIKCFDISVKLVGSFRKTVEMKWKMPWLRRSKALGLQVPSYTEPLTPNSSEQFVLAVLPKSTKF